jgi:hypothetical protein
MNSLILQIISTSGTGQKQTFHVKLESERGLQTVALSNMPSTNSSSTTQGADGQYFIPGK